MKIPVLILILVVLLSSCTKTYPEMILIPGGEFTLGIHPNGKITQFISDTTLSLNAQPAQKIFLNAFLLDQYEVTYKSFRNFKPNLEYKIRDSREPIRGVSWYEADAFCLSQGKRLPTEMEWEKAARGVDERLFVWGSNFNTNYANFGKTVQPVGLKSKDITIYGLADMNGNVSEWTSSWYQPYPNTEYKDKLFGKNVKVMRGGSFHKTDHGFMKEFVMLPYRNFASPENRYWDTGFRCAKST